MADTGYSYSHRTREVHLSRGMRARNDQSAIGISVDRPVRSQAHVRSVASAAELIRRPVMNGAGGMTWRMRKTLDTPHQDLEFSQNLHCSIIGTCLSTASFVRHSPALGLAQAIGPNHDLHHKAVSLAARHDQAARLLHKALDRVTNCPSVSSAKPGRVEVSALWRAAVKRGDIPGAYWAVLTHPATTQAVVRLVFGEVHMLSHLVGAANRADIRRLCDLEARNAELETKLRRQQEALHQAVVTRDASIRDLRQSLRQRLTEDAPVSTVTKPPRYALWCPTSKSGSPPKAAAGPVRKPAQGNPRRVDARTRGRDALESEAAALRTELATIEAAVSAGERGDTVADGRFVAAYVGGRPNQIAHLRALAKDRGAALLHHDGGIEHHPDLLPA